MSDDLDLGTALDLAAGYAARLDKDARVFAKLADVLRAVHTAQASVAAADVRLSELTLQEHDTHDRLQTLGVTLALKSAEVDEAQAAAASTLNALHDRMTDATQAALEVIRGAEESAAAKRAQLDADYQARKTTLQAEIDGLEARKSALIIFVTEHKARVEAL